MERFQTNATTAPISFFHSFNNGGALSSLPAGSFDTGNITTVGDGFFDSFNHNGALTSLPAGSFDTGSITTVGVGGSFFFNFNYNGRLTSLPTSFVFPPLALDEAKNRQLREQLQLVIHP
jgi:surface protein